MEQQDTDTVIKMLKKGDISPQILAWVFFKKHFLLPDPDTNKLANDMCTYMYQEGYTVKSILDKNTAKVKFVNWIRSKWRPTKFYPFAVRARPHFRSSKGRLALVFENKLWNLYDSLFGPNRKIKAGKTTLRGIGGQLGLFCACDKLEVKDIVYIWGDLHQVNCTDEEWKFYNQHYSSCFELDSLGIPKRFLYTGPASLSNHHCEESHLSIASNGRLTSHGKKKFKNGEEIFIHYGDHYFVNKKCVCCM